MATNEDNSLPNRHTLYMATSGGCKSQAMGLNPEVKEAQRVIFWDPHNVYKAKHYSSLVTFAKELKKATAKDKFRIAYHGKISSEIFNEFCRLVWSVADGRKITYVCIDETAEVTDSIGKDKTPLGEMARGGRKYGLRVHVTAIRSAEIPKTIYSQCMIKWIGVLSSTSDAKVAADYLRIPIDQILDLELEMAKKNKGIPDNKPKTAMFYVKSPGESTQLKTFKTKKTPL